MSELAPDSFGVLLRDKLAEFDADEAAQMLSVDDPVERLRLDALRAVLAEHPGPMTRSGHQAYATPPAPPAAEPGRQHVNILH